MGKVDTIDTTVPYCTVLLLNVLLLTLNSGEFWWILPVQKVGVKEMWSWVLLLWFCLAIRARQPHYFSLVSCIEFAFGIITLVDLQISHVVKVL